MGAGPAGAAPKPCSGMGVSIFRASVREARTCQENPGTHTRHDKWKRLSCKMQDRSARTVCETCWHVRISIRALCQALPPSVRAVWDVFRDSLGMAMSESKARPTWSGIPLDALPQDITKKIFRVLSPAVQREYKEVAATEAAGYIYYRRLRASLGKSDIWDALTSAEKLEFVPMNPIQMLRAQTEAWQCLLELLGIHPVWTEPLPDETGRPFLEHLEPRELQLLCCLLRTAPPVFRSCQGPLSRMLVDVDPAVKAEQAPPIPSPCRAKAMNAETCVAIEEALLKPYPMTQPVWGQQMDWGTCLHSLVQACRRVWGVYWPRECILVCGTAAELFEPFRLQHSAKHVLCVLGTETHWSLAAGRRDQRELLVFDGLQLPSTLDLAEAVAEHTADRWGQEMIVLPMQVPKQEDTWSCGHRVLAAAQWVLNERCSSWPLQPVDGCLALVEPRAGAKKEPAAGGREDDKPESRTDAKEEPTAGGSEDDEGRDLVVQSGQKRPREDDEEDDVEPAEQPRKQKRQLTAKQKKQQILDQAKTKAAEGGVTFNKNFQSVHSSNKDACPEGHWVKFLTALGKDSCVACKSCRQLRDMIRAPAGQEVVPAQAEQVVVAKPYAGRGRPPAGSVCASLESWLARERPGIYERVHGNVWWCRACKIECNFQRPSQSAQKYVKGHEGATHQRMLRSLQTPDAKPETCRGVRVGNGDDLSLDRFQDSVESWVKAGMLRTVDTKHPEKDPLETCSFFWEQEVLVLKSRACKGHGPICVECRNVAGRAMLHRAICKWACIIDTALLARQVVYGGCEDVMKVKEKDAELGLLHLERHPRRGGPVHGDQGPLVPADGDQEEDVLHHFQPPNKGTVCMAGGEHPGLALHRRTRGRDPGHEAALQAVPGEHRGWIGAEARFGGCGKDRHRRLGRQPGPGFVGALVFRDADSDGERAHDPHLQQQASRR